MKVLFCTTINITPFGSATHYTTNSMCIKCIYSEHRTSITSRRVRANEHTHTTNTNTSKVLNIVFSLATDISVACIKIMINSIAGTAAYSRIDSIKSFAYQLYNTHSNPNGSQIWIQKPQLYASVFILAYKRIHTFIHSFIRGYSFTQTLLNTASSIKVKYCVAYAWYHILFMPIFFSWQSAPLLSISRWKLKYFTLSIQHIPTLVSRVGRKNFLLQPNMYA